MPATSTALDAARTAAADARAAEVRIALAAVEWCEAHAERGASFDDWHLGGDVELMLAGAGAPGVSEFAVIEWGAAMGQSTDAARSYLGDVLELRHRLPRLWERVTVEQQVPVWQARRVAEATKSLNVEAAAYVDRQVTLTAGMVGPALLQRTVETAIARFDPGLLQDAQLAGQDHRRFDIDLHPHNAATGALHHGTVEVTGTLSLADARDLENAISRIAHDLLVAGGEMGRDLRRSMAAGELARRQTSLDLTAAGSDSGTEAREVVLHVHLDPNGRTARAEGWAADLSVESVAEWVRDTHTRVTIRPVLDPTEPLTARGYAPTDRQREQVIARDRTCVFPWCTRSARRADLDHIQPYEAGGSTETGNLAALCRRHHRVKTHGGWTYRPLDPVTAPGTYVWTSPSGDSYARTRDGTTPISRYTRRPHQVGGRSCCLRLGHAATDGVDEPEPRDPTTPSRRRRSVTSPTQGDLLDRVGPVRASNVSAGCRRGAGSPAGASTAG